MGDPLHNPTEQTSLTDAGVPRRRVANQREVMTRQLELLYVFEHKTQYLLIRAPYTRIVVCGHISNISVT